ncbi:hypothetical protein J4H89_24925 (plasmid) [Ralstonia solanacearum]|nr:hypothetical protein J4H89_24925 [Ralstonia solanacearum]
MGDIAIDSYQKFEVGSEILYAIISDSTEMVGEMASLKPSHFLSARGNPAHSQYLFVLIFFGGKLGCVMGYGIKLMKRVAVLLRVIYWKSSAAFIFMLAFVMSGCAHRQLSDANVIKKGRANDAASKTINTVSSDDPKIVFKSRGMPAIVAYSISSSPQNCQGFERVGRVFDSGRGVLLPWIANVTEKANKAVNRAEVSRERQVPAGVPVQIMGYSRWSNSSTNAIQTTIWSQSCGPLVTSFRPEASRTYLVEFVFGGANGCQQEISDITNPEQPIPVTEQVTISCK